MLRIAEEALSLDDFTEKLRARTATHAGYPYNLAFSYPQIAALLEFHLNNLGDPYRSSNYGIHSREYEQRCIGWLAELYGLGRDHWGYVTSCGTEGNLYGILLGREILPDAVLYFSADTHYSVAKAARMFRLPYEVVDAHPDGSIDVAHFERRLAANRAHPAIVVCSLGTTLKGALDDLGAVGAALERSGVESFVHCDGALAGLMLPFMEGAPRASFATERIDSLAVSGHKFLGAPFPCGMVLTKRRYVDVLERVVEYIGHDSTIMGSRNGLAPIFLWHAIAESGRDFAAEVAACRRNAEYLLERVRRIDETAFLNPFSTTVVLRAALPDDFIRRWQLPVDGGLTHCVVMQNLTPPVLDTFADELARAWQG